MPDTESSAKRDLRCTGAESGCPCGWNLCRLEFPFPEVEEGDSPGAAMARMEALTAAPIAWAGRRQRGGSGSEALPADSDRLLGLLLIAESSPPDAAFFRRRNDR